MLKARYWLAAAVTAASLALGAGVAGASPVPGPAAPAAGMVPVPGPALMQPPAVTSPLAAPQVQVCVPSQPGNPGYCLNRNGGGTGDGTKIIYYSFNDPNNDFTFIDAGAFVCGLYNTVHNGENGCWGPFTVGSGLNQRYDGKFLYRFWYYHSSYSCASVPDLAQRGLVLGNCASQGTVYVNSNSFVVGVAQSNYEYAHSGLYDDPWWMHDEGFGFQVITKNLGDEIWQCFGSGIGNC